jgi:hypothetical protein
LAQSPRSSSWYETYPRLKACYTGDLTKKVPWLPTGIRTRVFVVRGRCPWPLDFRYLCRCGATRKGFDPEGRPPRRPTTDAAETVPSEKERERQGEPPGRKGRWMIGSALLGRRAKALTRKDNPPASPIPTNLSREHVQQRYSRKRDADSSAARVRRIHDVLSSALNTAVRWRLKEHKAWLAPGPAWQPSYYWRYLWLK